MNYTYISGLTLATLIISIYFIKSYKKFSQYQMPFLKAFNPTYDVDRYHADELKKSIMPILSELETSRMANFINLWKKKFENNALTIEDVKFLNEQLVAGNTNQVNGILAIHPKAIEMYNTLNETLNSIEKEAFQEELVEV
ncbi:hypothetical protein [Pedobacter foliorum]|uniref:hypothetical protein n=1 Tax=Pedobacter foliorum TaxID=2739058 RepID=UPI0015656AE8|nr:hypothetical protein [Pedobacter foliorum]NRF41113.1 hypothetical protein [Pedobacter foliorum]